MSSLFIRGTGRVYPDGFNALMFHPIDQKKDTIEFHKKIFGKFVLERLGVHRLRRLQSRLDITLLRKGLLLLSHRGQLVDSGVGRGHRRFQIALNHGPEPCCILLIP